MYVISHHLSFLVQNCVFSSFFSNQFFRFMKMCFRKVEEIGHPRLDSCRGMLTKTTKFGHRKHDRGDLRLLRGTFLDAYIHIIHVQVGPHWNGMYCTVYIWYSVYVYSWGWWWTKTFCDVINEISSHSIILHGFFTYNGHNVQCASVVCIHIYCNDSFSRSISIEPYT